MGTQKILSTGLKQRLGTGPKRTSVLCLSHPHCFRYNDLFSPPLVFYFSPPPPVLYYGFYYLLFDLMHRREFLISVIRLTYSEGGIYLLVCLFACFPPRSSTVVSTPLFDSTWYDNPKHLSTTGSFFITKMKQKIRKQKEMVLLDWHHSEPGIMGWLSDRICCWRAVSWVGWV